MTCILISGVEKSNYNQHHHALSQMPSTSFAIHPNASHANVPSKVPSSNRPILKARRQANPPFICVLDTNVLIENLNTIKSLILNNQSKKKSGSNNSKCITNNRQQQVLKTEIDHIVIPWIVHQELDGIKMAMTISSEKGKEAQNAIKFINEQLSLPSSLLRCEPERNGANRMTESTLTIENNDDKILDCCIRLTELYPSDKFRVVLLSNDIALQNKSMVYQIESYKMTDFARMYMESAPKFQFNGSTSQQQPKMVQKETKELGPKAKRLKSSTTANSTHFSPVSVVKQMVDSIRNTLATNKHRNNPVGPSNSSLNSSINSTAISGPKFSHDSSPKMLNSPTVYTFSKTTG